jgi:hypothetical protein
MNKTGNQHSNLLDKLIEASHVQKEDDNNFAQQIMESIKQPAQPTLRQILSEVVKSGGKTKISKTAQFDAPADPGMAGPPADAGPMPEDEGAPTNEPADTEGAKESLCEALIALCGDIESAHACLDQHSGEQVGGEEMPDMDSDIPGATDTAPPAPPIGM